MADRTVKVIVDVVTGNGAKAETEVKRKIKGIADEAEKQTKRRVSDEQRAAKEVERINSQTARQAAQQEKIIEQANKTRLREQVKAQKQAANSFLDSLKESQAASTRIASQTQGVFSSVLGGSFFGTLGANGVSFFMRQLSTLPVAVADTIEKAVKISESRLNALKGLESIANFKDINAAYYEENRTGLLKIMTLEEIGRDVEKILEMLRFIHTLNLQITGQMEFQG